MPKFFESVATGNRLNIGTFDSKANPPQTKIISFPTPIKQFLDDERKGKTRGSIICTDGTEITYNYTDVQVRIEFKVNGKRIHGEAFNTVEKWTKYIGYLIDVTKDTEELHRSEGYIMTSYLYKEVRRVLTPYEWETGFFPLQLLPEGMVKIYKDEKSDHPNLYPLDDLFFGLKDIPPEDPGGNSKPGGGGGSFDSSTDIIEFPGSPGLSAVSAGFITLFTPTVTQLNNLSSYLWSDAFTLDSFKKIFADPMDIIIGLSILPIQVASSGSRSVKIGLIDTGVVMNTASNQYAEVNCGTVQVSEFWGSALDYAPYTKFSIYLPYIGTREIKTDDIMGKSVTILYRIDILSGACTAMIKVNGSVLYQYSGACAIPVPVTSQNWTQLLTSTIQLAGTGITAAAGANPAGLISAAATAVASAKPNIQRSGSVSGSAGALGVQVPYLIAELPRQSLAVGYNKYLGYPSNITSALSDLEGYTEVEEIHLSGVTASDNELAEIERLLKEGVIL